MFHSAQAVSKDDRKLFMIQKVHAETFIDFRRETLISKWGQEFPWFPVSEFDLKRPKVKKHGSRVQKIPNKSV